MASRNVHALLSSYLSRGKIKSAINLKSEYKCAFSSAVAPLLSTDSQGPLKEYARSVEIEHVSSSLNLPGKSILPINKSKRGVKRMPRLEQLRQRLHSENVATEFPSSTSLSPVIPTLSVPRVKLEKNVKKGKKSNEFLENSEGNSPSWKKILAQARTKNMLLKEQASIHTINSDNMLIDKYSRHHSYLRISLAERCNLRCQYCMPPEGVPIQSSDKLLNHEEVERLTRIFAQGGVDKVRLTGGEPLLRKDLARVISSISSIDTIHSVGITTNGITLSRKLSSLIDAGLTHINISLDTLQEHKFLEITRRNGLTKVLQAIKDASAALPQGRVKINCVVMKNFNENEIRDFILLTKTLPIDVRFIEWMPFSDNGWSKNRFISYNDMKSLISGVNGDETQASLQGVPPLQLVRLKDGANDTTKWWTVEGYKGRVGFITSMSEHFCGTCNRLRITADGKLKVCLFGSTEVSLRDAMRAGVSDEDLQLIVNSAVQKKNFALGGHGNAEGIAKANDNRPMTLIGG